MLKHLNGLLCLKFKRHKWVLDYSKSEWYCGIWSFLSLPNIILLFSLYVRYPSTILQFSQNFKLAFFALSFDKCFGKYLLLTKFSICLKSTCLLLVIFLNFMQSERKAWFCFRKKELFLENSCSWIFYFSQFNVFIACHLSKKNFQPKQKVWFYLAQNFQFFISKTLEFLFKVADLFIESSCSWISKI